MDVWPGRVGEGRTRRLHFQNVCHMVWTSSLQQQIRSLLRRWRRLFDGTSCHSTVGLALKFESAAYRRHRRFHRDWHVIEAATSTESRLWPKLHKRRRAFGNQNSLHLGHLPRPVEVSQNPNEQTLTTIFLNDTGAQEQNLRSQHKCCIEYL